jgi:hypothetical protein
MLATRMRMFTETLVIDDFERGNITPYSGDTAGYQISTEVSRRGLYSIKAISASTATDRIVATTGLDAYFPRGFCCNAFMYLHSNFNLMTSDAGFIFGGQDTDNNFVIRFNPSTNDWRIVRRQSATNTVIATKTVNRSVYPKDEWLKIEVKWYNNGDIAVALYQEDGTFINDIEANDNQFANNVGVGFYASSGSTTAAARRCYFDDILLAKHPL